MTQDEKKAAILAVARNYPLGIERNALLAEAGLSHNTGYPLMGAMNREGVIGYVRGADNVIMWTAEEYLADLRAGMQCKSDKVRRRWPEYSSYVEPQPRIPSVWHLGQL